VPPAKLDLPPGTVFASRYEIRDMLGRGGMSVVFEAHDRTRGETVALKVLSRELSALPEMERRFASEIPAAARIRQPNVCHIYGWGEAGGLRYIAMERVVGHDLGKVLSRDGAFPTDQAFDLAIQIGRAVQALHAAGILHRDVKPKNIMLGNDGQIRIMDFDIAKHCGEGAAVDHEAGFGTPEYASPEQACGGAVDFRSDVYSVGVVVYELFSGRVPFRAATSVDTVRLHLHAPVPLEGPDAPILPAALVPVLRKALAKEPARRYTGVKGLVEALRLARSVTPASEETAPVSPAPAVSADAPTLARSLPALLAALNERDKTVRWTEPTGRRSLDTKTRLAIATLLETIVHDESPDAAQGPRAEGIRALLDALNDDDETVRREAATELQRIARSR
jgi:serine/threonine-protein kinase